MAAKRFFRPDLQSERGTFFPGVPMRDLSEEEFDGLPEWLRNSVDTDPTYQKSPPTAAQRAARPRIPGAPPAPPEPPAPEPTPPEPPAPPTGGSRNT